jgi:hypothetical protein
MWGNSWGKIEKEKREEETGMQRMKRIGEREGRR